jgi:hypothetical protein
MKRRKYQLPPVAELTHININLTQLQLECDKFANKYVDVMTANPALCDNHKDLVSSVYDSFHQINLTELNGESMKYTNNIKERIRRKEETLYNKPTEDFLNSYFKEITDQFIEDKMRVRITKLEPGKEISWHIDYDPTYAVRIIVPIYTNHDVRNMFRIKKYEIDVNLEAGKAYFLNTGFSHAVFNKSNKPRIALMFSLSGQKDIEYLTLEDSLEKGIK